MSKTANKYSLEGRERAVTVVLRNEGQYESRFFTILEKINCVYLYYTGIP